MGKVYATDVGTLIKLDTERDISAATSHKIIAKLGTGVATNLTTTIVETTKLQHVKTASTLSSAGLWSLQAYVQFSDGSKYWGEIVELTIYAPLA